MKATTKPLPKMFIGSSTECLSIVDEFVQAFSRHVSCVPWNLAPEFKTSGSFTTFNALCDAARFYDFALFVLTPDDKLEHHSKHFACPRDNVIFEMGLFIGAIGAQRVLACVSRDSADPIKLPSDLLSVNMPRFGCNKVDRHGLIASINAEIQGFAVTIAKLGFHPIELNLALGWECLIPGPFEVKLGAGPLTSTRSTIDNRKIAIAARVDNPLVNFEDDKSVVYSQARALPDDLNDMVFQIPQDRFNQIITVGAKIQGRVVLVPQNLDLEDYESLKEAVSYGCKVVEPVSVKVRERPA